MRHPCSEERFCRFCSTELPDWKTALTPSHLKPAEPIMVVTLGSEVHRIKVKPGPEGVKEFEGKIRALFNIPPEVEFEVGRRNVQYTHELDAYYLNN